MRARTSPRTSSLCTPALLRKASTIVQRNAKGQLVPVKNHPAETATPAQLAASAEQIAKGLGAQLIALETPNAD